MDRFVKILLIVIGFNLAVSSLYAQSEKLIDNQFPVPKRLIMRDAIIQESDLHMQSLSRVSRRQDVIALPDDIIGMQARRPLHKDKPITSRDIGPPILVKRNKMVTLIYHKGGLLLSTSGRALEEGGSGDVVRVMNIDSRKIISGVVTQQGDVNVSLSR